MSAGSVAQSGAAYPIHANRRRLAGSVGAQKAVDLAAFNHQIKVFHGLDCHLSAAEGLADILSLIRDGLCH